MEAVNEFLQAAINLLLMMLIILVPVIARWVSFRAIEFWAVIRASMPEQVSNSIEFAARLGVMAAEQFYRSNQIMFNERKDKALEIAARWLEHQGYEIDLTVIDNAIEAILGEINKDN